MKNYTITMLQSEIFLISTKAEDEAKAVQTAYRQFEEGDYLETGKLVVQVASISKE